MQYLIKRGDWFYFSMRVQSNGGKLFRMALKTRKRTKAYDIVQMVIDKIEGTKVSIKVLKLIVQEEIDRVIDKATALVTPDSEQGKQEFNRYYNGHFIPNSSHNHHLYSSGGVNGVDLSEFEKPVQRFDTWVKSEIKEVNTGYKLEQELREDPHRQFDKDYVQQNVLIELLNEYVNDIKSTKTTALAPLLENLTRSFNRSSYSPIDGNIPTKKTLTYLDALDKYKTDMDSYLYKTEKGKPIESKRSNETLGWIQDFALAYFGDGVNVHDIDYSQFDEMLTVLSGFPKRSVNPYKQMSLEECLDLARSGETPEEVRQDKALVRVKSMFNRFFTWLYDTNMINTNPVKESRFKRFTDLSSRGAFDKSELRILREYYDNLSLDDHGVCFYMQLFSGMRNKEILGLKASDIRTDDETNVMYFYVKGTKTENALRRIPVHKYLVDRGVVDYIKSNNGFTTSASAISIKFTKLLRALDISNVNEYGELLSFYSLRHNFMTSLASYGATDVIINAIVGHTQKGTKKDYISSIQIDLNELDNVVQAIPD